VIHHIGFEVRDLAASARFYDAVFYALGARRIHEHEHAIAYGQVEPVFWLTARNAPAPAYGHVALRAVGRAAVQAAHAAGLASGGRDDGPPGPRPQYGTYAAYLRDPDGLRVELVAIGS
jgi:catechol 2,3-dioxygenase-like lactoylglutathione lyase family enzyme